MAHIGYESRWIVTEDNIDDVIDDMACGDQVDELAPGCETWGIIYEPGGQRGQMTIWPEEMRGAVCHGADSVWGDWDGEYLRPDDYCGVVYDADGEEVEEGDE